MSTTTPGRIGALAAGAAVMAGSLVAVNAPAFADDDDYDHYGTCSSAPVAAKDHDDYDDDDECDPAPAPSPTPTVSDTPAPAETTTPTANAMLSVQRESARRLAVDAGVENSNPGEAWRLEVWQNGRQRLSTTISADDAGTAVVKRALRNRPGTDKIKVVATDSAGHRVSAKVRGFKSAPRPPQNSNKNNGQTGYQNGSQSGNQNSNNKPNPSGTSKQS